MALVACLFVWAISFWLLEATMKSAVGARDVKFNTIFLFGWGSLMEQPPKQPSRGSSGQVLGYVSYSQHIDILYFYSIKDYCTYLDSTFDSTLCTKDSQLKQETHFHQRKELLSLLIVLSDCRIGWIFSTRQ